MNTIISQWYVWVTIAAICGVGGFCVGRFVKLPTSKQIEIVKKWLIYACVEAEHLWGSQTGKMKLLETYNWFIEKFPSLATIISFATFSAWVTDALVEAQHLMNTNDKIKDYVEE